MYTDEEKLERHKKTWLTEEVYKLAKKEKIRLWKEEKRKLSVQKVINNAVLEKYGNTRLRSEKGI